MKLDDRHARAIAVNLRNIQGLNSFALDLR